MKHIIRLAAVVGAVVGLGAGAPFIALDSLAAQTAQDPPPKNSVRMPPPAAMNTQAIAGQVVGVLPSTLVVARDSLAGNPPFVDRASSNQWVDAQLGDGMMMRAPEVNWKLPGQMRALARSAPGIAANPDFLGQAALRDPQIVKVPDPMISNFRTLMAIAGGRYLFIPASFSFQHDSTGAVEARGNFLGVDTRAGDVIFRSYITASGATPAEALDAVLEVLFPSVTIEP